MNNNKLHDMLANRQNKELVTNVNETKLLFNVLKNQRSEGVIQM